MRRKLTLKRIDPWTVLKFGFVVNVALLVVALLAFWVVWIAVGRLGLVDQFCGSVGTIVLDLRECSLNGGNIFRTYLFLGILGVVVVTGVMVLGAFLYNLIADLTGGLTFTFLDSSADVSTTNRVRAEGVAAGSTAARTSSAAATANRQPAPAGSRPTAEATGASGTGARPAPSGGAAPPGSTPSGGAPSTAASAPTRTSDVRTPGSSLWNDPTHGSE